MKQNLLLSDLVHCGAKNVSVFNKSVINRYGDISKPGYYFVFAHDDERCLARYYCGRQRTQQGFTRAISHIRTGRSNVSRSIIDRGTISVYYIPVEKIKHLLNKNRSFFVKTFSRTQSDIFENISEVNLLLSDQYKFLYQDY